MPYYLAAARQNRFPYSEEFDDAAWSKSNSSISANALTAPDGTATADKFVEDATNDQHYITDIVTIDADSIVTISVYAKAGERDFINLQTANTSNWSTLANCVFDLSTGTILSGTGTIENVGNGWYRCSITETFGASTATGGLHIFLNNGGTTYLGDGVSGAYIWGAQMTYSDGPTPYLKTTGTAVTTTLDYVTVQPNYDFKDSGEKIESRHRSRDGSEYVYKWGDFEKISMSVSYVNSSFMAQVNSWWSSNGDLAWLDNAVVENVRLTNRSKPIDQFVKPHTDLFKGKIELGTY